ncbi:hypothetical protein A9266_18405 [Vibrio tasmaniensis]|nr:hypothetical protein A9266_18405 [Vibrio tasmaniensis]
MKLVVKPEKRTVTKTRYNGKWKDENLLMFVFMWKHFEFQAAITRVYAKSAITKVLKLIRFHVPSLRIMSAYVQSCISP